MLPFHVSLHGTYVPSNEILYSLKSMQNILLKRKVMRLWKGVNEWKEKEQCATKYFQTYLVQKWWDQCRYIVNLSQKAKQEQVEIVQKANEEREMERNYKVAAIVHFLDQDDEMNMDMNTNMNMDDEESTTKNENGHNIKYNPSPLTLRNLNVSPFHEEEKKCHEKDINKVSKTTVNAREKERMKYNNNSNKKRMIDSETKRQAIKEKYIQARKEREKRALNAKNKRDEEARKAYLNRKKEEKRILKKKQNAIEMTKKAYQLAKLHYSIMLLRRYFIHRWMVYVHNRRLLWVKATRFWTHRMRSRCLLGLSHYTIEKRKREERNQFRNAGMFRSVRSVCKNHPTFFNFE
jgi:hypothetical protein